MLKKALLTAVAVIGIVMPTTTAAAAAPPDKTSTTIAVDGTTETTNGDVTVGWAPEGSDIYAAAKARASASQSKKQPSSPTVQSAYGCNQDVCIDIRGTSTYIDTWRTQAFGNVGCTYARYWVNGSRFYSGNQVCPTSSGDGVYYWIYNYGGRLYDNDKVCNSWDRIAGYPCKEIQR